jgi:AsmA protein
MDLREQAREMAAKLKREPYNAPPKKPTNFSAITASLNFNRGTVRNQDLDVRAGHIYITGEGEYALPTDMIDYTPTILISRDSTGQDDDLKDFHDVPIKPHLKGKLENLDYVKIMTSAFGSAFNAVLKARFKKKVEEEKDAAQEKAKDKFRDKLKDKLGL